MFHLKRIEMHHETMSMIYWPHLSGQDWVAVHGRCNAGNTESVISLTPMPWAFWWIYIREEIFPGLLLFWRLSTSLLETQPAEWVQLNNKIIVFVQNTMTSRRRPVGDISDAGQMHKKLQDIHQTIIDEKERLRVLKLLQKGDLCTRDIMAFIQQQIYKQRWNLPTVTS